MEKEIRNYLNGTANPQEFSKVVEALCDPEKENQVSAALIESWNKSLEAEIPERENNQLLEIIRYRIALSESDITIRRLRLYKNLLKVAAVLILGLLVTTLFVYNRQGAEQYTTVKETVTTPYGARTNFKLSDGSEVWLNSGSSISFPKQFSTTRNIELSGQAYFKVVKDGKPFVVQTAYGKIEVMGTSFDAKAYAEENFETTLVEGSVKVVSINNQVTELKPGQQATISHSGQISTKNVNTENTTSWREGKLVFVKTPFAEVAKDLERWYNVKMELQGDRLKKIGYTGTIEQETFGEVLELINATTPIKYSFDKKTRILRISGK